MSAARAGSTRRPGLPAVGVKAEGCRLARTMTAGRSTVWLRSAAAALAKGNGRCSRYGASHGYARMSWLLAQYDGAQFATSSKNAVNKYIATHYHKLGHYRIAFYWFAVESAKWSYRRRIGQ